MEDPPSAASPRTTYSAIRLDLSVVFPSAGPASEGQQIGPAVLVLAFRRADELQSVLAALNHARPRIVYISVDGPRAHVSTDADDVARVRALVQNMPLNYPRVTRFSSVNGGVGKGVCGAIDWFFSHETSGVILEDDVLIEPTSLDLMGQCLSAFESSSDIGSITLFNAVPSRIIARPSDTFRLSRIPSSQYWGTWRDRWRQVKTIDDWRETVGLDRLAEVGGHDFAKRFATELDDDIKHGNDSWEGRWITTHWARDWKVVVTNVNYSLHLGFSNQGTNSTEQPSWYPTRVVAWTGAYRWPSHWEVDGVADRWYLNQRFGLSRMKRLKRWLREVLPWLSRLWRSITVRPIRDPSRMICL